MDTSETLSWEGKLDIYRKFREGDLTRTEAKNVLGDDWNEVSQAGSIRFAVNRSENDDVEVIPIEGDDAGGRDA